MSDDEYDDEAEHDEHDEVGLTTEELDQAYEQGEDPGAYRFDDPAGEDTSDVVFLTKLWGATETLQVIGLTPTQGVTQQVADVRMPEPLVCTVYLQVSFAAGSGVIDLCTLTQQIGLGRTTVTQRRVFANQPDPSNDLTVTFQTVPMINLLANITINGSASPTSSQVIGTNPAFTLNLTIQVAPITRAKVTAEHKVWGMALPGEADSLDDELDTDIEPLQPTHDQRAMVELAVNQLQKRLGRRPAPGEVRAAVARMEARQARRAPQRRQPSALRQAFIQHTIATMRQRLGRPPSKAELRQELSRHQVPE